MRILIDASRLNTEKPTGTNNFLFNLIFETSLADQKNKYTLCFKNSPSSEYFEKLTNKNPNFELKIISKKYVWNQLYFALETYSRNYDLILCPWQTMPIFYDRSKMLVSVIHDEGFNLKTKIMTLLTCHLSGKLICVSNFSKSEISSKYFVQSSKIDVIYEGGLLNTNFEQIELSKLMKKYNISDKFILFVGTFEERKNILNMIKAFESSKLYENYQFLLLGKSGDSFNAVSNYIESRSLSNKIKMLGFVSIADYLNLLKNALFLSFVSKKEGFGIPPLEAMNIGTPVLTSNTSSLGEIYADSALLATPTDVDEIARSMNEFLNEAKRAEYIRKGTDKSLKMSWKKTAESFINYINKHEKSN